MRTTIYFLRHGKTQVDAKTPISKWELDEQGMREAEKVTGTAEFQNADVIIASGEEKAFQTVKGLADKLGKDVLRMPELSELDRDKVEHLTYEQYEAAVHQALSAMDAPFKGKDGGEWETANHALDRFSKKVDEISKQFEGKTILIVGHGYTMNLYFAKLAGELRNIHERLESNKFADWGMICDGKVIKDLAKGFERPGEKLV